MRHRVVALVLALTPVVAARAQPSAAGRELRDYGGFVGLDLRFGDVRGEFGAFVGGHAALLLKNRVTVGVRGAGLATENALAGRAGDGAREPLSMGYGGITLGYVVPSRSLVQLTADVLVGAGGVDVSRAAGATGGRDEEGDAVFLFEPSVGVEVKLAPFVRVGVGASYRFVGDVDVPGVRDADLRGVAGAVTVRVGKF
jgi:hypothetical protein